MFIDLRILFMHRAWCDALKRSNNIVCRVRAEMRDGTVCGFVGRVDGFPDCCRGLSTSQD